MAEGRIKSTELSAIAAAIRSKNGESTVYKPAEMAQAILDIPTGGAPVIESKSITENGTYTAPTGVDGYNPVTVAVQPNLQSKTATENGTVTPDTGYDGLSSVVVNVSGRVWVPITPTVYNASYTDSNSCLAIDNPKWPSYRIIALDLNEFSGKLIQIDNRANDRNWWGLFSSVSHGQAIVWPDARQSESSKTLTFFADDFHRLSNYLVYDFTSSNQDPPIVKVLTP